MLRQWVTWKAVQRAGRVTKVPYKPGSAGRASTTEPSTWAEYDDAIRDVETGRRGGVGFVFTEDDDYIGLDIDGCRDPVTGEITAQAWDCIRLLDSYAEISPSGKGVHVIARGRLKAGIKRGSIEMYDRGRYFTVTGLHITGTPTTINDRESQVKAVYYRILDDDLIAKASTGKDGDTFSRLWAGNWDGYPSQSEADLALCRTLAFQCKRDPSAVDRLFRRSGLMRPKWDEPHFGDGRTYGQATVGQAVSGTAGREAGANGKGPTQAELIVRAVDESEEAGELWHDPDAEPWATVKVNDHRENWPISGRRFRRWAAGMFYRKAGRPAGAEALAQALMVLEARAVHEGKEYEVHTRIAAKDGNVFVDLGNAEWLAVCVSSAGWNMVSDPPVRFRRTNGMRPLPMPIHGGNSEILWKYINLDEPRRALCLGCLIAAFCPSGPYPVLAFTGEQGSGKSTAARVTRRLIDPNGADLRAPPHDARDLALTAKNGWYVVLDNVSTIEPWLSDALCRLTTGGGFATRQLYRDDDEVIFESCRPVIVTSIEDVVTRSDLLDRAVIISPETLEDESRRPESELWAAFEKDRPVLLGCLLDAASMALRNLAHVDGPLERMADFQRWAMAAMPAVGYTAEDFQSAYKQNRGDANSLALEASPVAAPIQELLKRDGGFDGTVGALLDQLNDLVSETIRGSKTWPRTPRAMGGALKRVSPNLRAAGVTVQELGKLSGKRRVKIVQGPKEPGDGGHPGKRPQRPNVRKTASGRETGRGHSSRVEDGYPGNVLLERGHESAKRGHQDIEDVSPDVQPEGSSGNGASELSESEWDRRLACEPPEGTPDGNWRRRDRG
jgi:hypothetical protein